MHEQHTIAHIRSLLTCNQGTWQGWQTGSQTGWEDPRDAWVDDRQVCNTRVTERLLGNHFTTVYVHVKYVNASALHHGGVSAQIQAEPIAQRTSCSPGC
jgi:hypothetical protein